MKKELSTDKAPKAIGPYSQGVEAAGFVYLSGQVPIDPLSGELIRGDIKAQTRQALTNLKSVLESAGLEMNSIVKTTVYLKDLSNFAEMNGVYGEFFSSPFPARATVGVASLPKGAEIEIDAIAVRG